MMVCVHMWKVDPRKSTHFYNASNGCWFEFITKCRQYFHFLGQFLVEKTLKTIFYKVDLKISSNPKICRFLPTFFQLILLMPQHFQAKILLFNKSFLKDFLNFNISVNQKPIFYFFFGKVRIDIKIFNSCLFRSKSKYTKVKLQESYDIN